MDELLQELSVRGVTVTPHLDQQPVAAHRVAGIRKQHLQQSQLQLGEPDRIAIANAHGVLVDVESNTASRQRSRVLHAGTAQQRLDACQQGSGTEGLREVVIRTQLEGPDEIFLLPAHGEHDDGYARVAADRLAHLKSARPGHVDVEDDEVRGFRLERAQCGRTVAGFHDEIPCLSECESDQVAKVAIVVGDQHLHALLSEGREMANRVRPCSVRMSVIVPACRSIMDFTIHRPRPRPPGSGSSSAPRCKRAKIASVSPGSGPGPSSSTQATTWPGCDSAPMRTVVSSGANLLAFARRLTNTCVRRGLSPSIGGKSSGSSTSSF